MKVTILDKKTKKCQVYGAVIEIWHQSNLIVLIRFQEQLRFDKEDFQLECVKESE